MRGRGALLGSVLGVLLAVSGCERTSDVPRLQDEARATAKQYQERFDELAHRAELISKRGNTIRADALNSADAQRVYRQALTLLDDNRRILQQVPKEIQAGGSADDPDALPKLIDSLRERFERAVTEINSELDAVESWIGNVEQQQGSRSVPPPPSPAAPPADDPGPASSEAPIR